MLLVCVENSMVLSITAPRNFCVSVEFCANVVEISMTGHETKCTKLHFKLQENDAIAYKYVATLNGVTTLYTSLLSVVCCYDEKDSTK